MLLTIILFFAKLNSISGDSIVETLKNPKGGGEETAKNILTKLEQIYRFSIMGSPDSYEINTVGVKDPLSTENNRKIGYGLWDKHYIDNVLYGAVDYIYMVDSFSEGMYKDELGVTDVGSGG